MAVTNVSDSTFDSEVLDSKTPVIVDIWAEWCGPCRMYSPVIDEVSKEYEGKIKFVKVNADECERVVQKYNVTSIPTTLLIKNGEVKGMNVGAVPREALKKWISSNL
ncbi:MAG: thioredoxin [Candidatus Micrarchaeota archaeon]|nr:thioredoxin [Candidatus Micrarchaeota archaeon]